MQNFQWNLTSTMKKQTHEEQMLPNHFGTGPFFGATQPFPKATTNQHIWLGERPFTQRQRNHFIGQVRHIWYGPKPWGNITISLRNTTIFQEWYFFSLNKNHQGWKWRCKKVWTYDLPHQFIYKSQYSNHAYHNHHNQGTKVFFED